MFLIFFLIHLIHPDFCFIFNLRKQGMSYILFILLYFIYFILVPHILSAEVNLY